MLLMKTSNWASRRQKPCLLKRLLKKIEPAMRVGACREGRERNIPIWQNKLFCDPPPVKVKLGVGHLWDETMLHPFREHPAPVLNRMHQLAFRNALDNIHPSIKPTPEIEPLIG